MADEARRSTPRFRVRVQTRIILLETIDGKPVVFEGFTENISAGGMLIRLSYGTPISIGKQLQGIILEDKTSKFKHEIKFIGVVLHIHNDGAFGLKITSIDQESKIELRKHLNRIATENPELVITNKEV